VIVPAYNSADFIGQALESILAQTNPPTEILVVDDGSTDNTVEVIRPFGEKVHILRQEHQGVSAARNRGVRHARGEYLAFLDSDDIWKPEKLEKQIACLIEKNTVWVCCAAAYFDSQTGQRLSGYAKDLFEGDVLEQEFLQSFILSPTPVIKRSVFDEVGYFDEGIHIGEDWDMWLRIAARYPIGVVREELALKREHPQSTMQRASTEEKLSDQLKIVEMVVAREPKRLEPLMNQLIAHIYMEHGIELVKCGAYPQARLCLAQAQQRAPGSLKLAAYRLALSFGDRNAAQIFGFIRVMRKLS